MIWHEVERALSTESGRPLDPAAAAAGTTYPFTQIGVLRLRLCLAVDAAPGADHPRHLLRPGESDLSMKLKGVDPAAPPDWHTGEWGGASAAGGRVLPLAACRRTEARLGAPAPR